MPPQTDLDHLSFLGQDPNSRHLQPARYLCRLLLVHHLRKRSRLPAMDLVTADDFRGSGHIIAMARSVLALSIIQEGPEPDRNGPRRLEIVKTNLCKYPPALGLVFESADPRAPTLRYTDPPTPYQKTTKTEECAAWIVDLLQETGKPLKPRDVIARAEAAGFKQGIVRRARRALEGVVWDTEEVNTAPTNRWGLAEWGDGEES